MARAQRPPIGDDGTQVDFQDGSGVGGHRCWESAMVCRVIRARSEMSEPAGARQTIFIVMAGEASTTCSVGLTKGVGGRPAPAMTISGVQVGIGALISRQALRLSSTASGSLPVQSGNYPGEY